MAAMMQEKIFENIKKKELDWQRRMRLLQVISALHEKDLQDRLHDKTLKLSSI